MSQQLIDYFNQAKPPIKPAVKAVKMRALSKHMLDMQTMGSAMSMQLVTQNIKDKPYSPIFAKCIHEDLQFLGINHLI